MTDRPITRIVSAEQALGIVRGTIIGADQRTLVDAKPPEMPPAPMQALPIPCSAAGPRTVIDGVPPSLVQHTAQALYGTHSVPNDARRLRPDQATMLDGVPAPIAPPPATRAPTQPTLVTVHSALGHPVREARILAPNQPTIVNGANGVPVVIVDDIPTVRVGQPQPAAAPASLPPPAAMTRRTPAIGLLVLACVGSALLAGGIVAALYERPAATPATPPPTEPARDAVLHTRR